MTGMRWHQFWLDRGDGRKRLVRQWPAKCGDARAYVREAMEDEPVMAEAELRCAATRRDDGAIGEYVCMPDAGLHPRAHW